MKADPSQGPSGKRPPTPLEQALGYAFENPALLQEALTHRSYVHEHRMEAGSDNERLEFLGDAVLDLIISDMLLKAFPDLQEGSLSRYRARLVNERRLAAMARRLHLGESLRLGRGEALGGGREKTSILADALEAVVAAVYRDGGLEAARKVVERLVQPDLTRLEESKEHQDYKTLLQERCQAVQAPLPLYRVVAEKGPDHRKVFEVEVVVEGTAHRGRGTSKKEAEQQAARAALAWLQQEGSPPFPEEKRT